MKESQIHDALGQLPEELLVPVEKLRAKKRYPVMKWAAAAACLCILLSLPLGWAGDIKAESTNNGSQEAAREPQYEAVSDSLHSESQTQAAVLRAMVLEVHDGYGIQVQPLEGEDEARSSDRIDVALSALEQVPQIQVGDIVEITYDGMIQETYPARIPGALSVRVIEP